MRAKPLKSRLALNIPSPSYLALRLGLPLDVIEYAIRNQGDLLYTFSLQDGDKKREIHAPYRGSALATVLQALKAQLELITLPKGIMGGRKGYSVARFAAPHIGKRLVIEIDLCGFFPSISRPRVVDLFGHELRCGRRVAQLLADLTTVDGVLPHGFHTSTHVANLVLRERIWRLQRLAQQHDAAVTVWVDNIVISGPEHLWDLRHLIARIIEGTDLRVHELRRMYHWEPQTICAVTVNSGLSWNAENRLPVEAAIAALRSGRLPNGFSSIPQAYEKLTRRLGGAKSLAPRQARKRRRLLDAAVKREGRRRCSVRPSVGTDRPQ